MFGELVDDLLRERMIAAESTDKFKGDCVVGQNDNRAALLKGIALKLALAMSVFPRANDRWDRAEVNGAAQVFSHFGRLERFSFRVD